MTKELWLERCANKLVAVANVETALALDIAESQLENLKGDLTEDPEEAADDELSYWTPD